MERVVPNALKDFRCGPSVLRASRSTFHCITGWRAWVAPAEWSALYRETRRANFELNLSHGSDVEVDKISAEMKDGILRLTLPKAEAVKPRKIAIN